MTTDPALDAGQDPDPEPALEPGQQDFPLWPMTAVMASPFIQKVVA